MVGVVRAGAFTAALPHQPRGSNSAHQYDRCEYLAVAWSQSVPKRSDQRRASPVILLVERTVRPGARRLTSAGNRHSPTPWFCCSTAGTRNPWEHEISRRLPAGDRAPLCHARMISPTGMYSSFASADGISHRGPERRFRLSAAVYCATGRLLGVETTGGDGAGGR